MSVIVSTNKLGTMTYSHESKIMFVDFERIGDLSKDIIAIDLREIDFCLVHGPASVRPEKLSFLLTLEFDSMQPFDVPSYESARAVE